MNQIILASHGGLAAGAKDTLEMVLGDVSNVHVVSLARDDKEPITNKVDAMIATFNADDTVYVLTDMLGSSVNNSMVELSRNGAHFHGDQRFQHPAGAHARYEPAPSRVPSSWPITCTGSTNPNAPVEIAAVSAKKAKASRHSSWALPRSSSHVLTTVCCTARSSLPGPPGGGRAHHRRRQRCRQR